MKKYVKVNKEEYQTLAKAYDELGWVWGTDGSKLSNWDPFSEGDAYGIEHIELDDLCYRDDPASHDTVLSLGEALEYLVEEHGLPRSFLGGDNQIKKGDTVRLLMPDEDYFDIKTTNDRKKYETHSGDIAIVDGGGSSLPFIKLDNEDSCGCPFGGHRHCWSRQYMEKVETIARGTITTLDPLYSEFKKLQEDKDRLGSHPPMVLSIDEIYMQPGITYQERETNKPTKFLTPSIMDKALQIARGISPVVRRRRKHGVEDTEGDLTSNGSNLMHQVIWNWKKEYGDFTPDNIKKAMDSILVEADKEEE